MKYSILVPEFQKAISCAFMKTLLSGLEKFSCRMDALWTPDGDADSGSLQGAGEDQEG